MPKYDIHSDDPLEMIWAVREKIYEETRNMSAEDRQGYIQSRRESFDKRLERIRQQAAADRVAGVPYKFPWE